MLGSGLYHDPVCGLLSPAGGGCGQAHESLHQHDREEALQYNTLREQPGQLQVKTSKPMSFSDLNVPRPAPGPDPALETQLPRPSETSRQREEFPGLLSPPIHFSDHVLSCQP